MDISVTNLAVINNDNRIFILNRITGLPAKGATVKAGAETKIVNAEGYILLKDLDAENIFAYSGNDTIVPTLNKPENNTPEVLYDKTSGVDLEDFYENNVRLNLFTDRGIYRPGQTVFFKGIFTVPDPKTGEKMVLDFQKLFKRSKTEVTVMDPFNRTMDTFPGDPQQVWILRGGTFVIPKDAATGVWGFNSVDYDMEDVNRGVFHVEEYKRPSFKLILTKPKTELKLGDPFNIQIKVRSYAGAPLARVHLRYRVSRYIERLGTTDILKGENFSNEVGEYILMVTDSFARVENNFEE